MQNFARFDGGENIPGYVNFFFIEDKEVLNIPAHVDGVVDMVGVVYANDTWHVGAAILGTLKLGNESKQTPDGPAYPVVIEGKCALKSAHNLHLFHEMNFRRWVVMIQDLNGGFFLCGEVNNGLEFSWKEIDGGLSFVFAATYTAPCWYATGGINLDGEAYGVNYLPVTTYIQGPAGAVVQQITDVVIAVGDWVLVGEVYEAEIENVNIAASTIVDIVPDDGSYDVVRAAEILPRTDSAEGVVTVRARNLPIDDIGVTLNLIT